MPDNKDKQVNLIIPLQEIVFIKKEENPPLASSLSNLFAFVSTNYYISVTVKSRKKFWFSSLHNRNDLLYDSIMRLMRSVEFPDIVSLEAQGEGDIDIGAKGSTRDLDSPTQMGLHFMFSDVTM